MRILVTGGAGFIGGHLSERFAQDGHNVTVLQTRDFTYIKDLIERNLTLLETGAADSQVVNVGNSDRIEIRMLAEEVRDQLALDLELKFVERHDADAEHTHADISKARELIECKLSRTIRKRVSELIEWYRESREWYEPLVLET